MKNSQQWQSQIDALQAEVKAIVDIATEENRELSAEEQTRVDAITGSSGAKGELAEAVEARDRATKVEAQVNAALFRQQPKIDNTPINEDTILDRIRVPLRFRNQHDTRCFQSEREAYASGQWLLATLGQNKAARNWCSDHGVMNAMSEGDSTKGGYLVPEFLSSSIIRIVENYGVFRQNSRVYPMSSEAEVIPRRNGGFTVYYVGENTAITASDLAFNRVRLQTRKPAVLTQVSSELSEDSIIGLANLMTQEFGYALAVSEDSAGFLGDGTSTYGGILGLKNAIAAGSINDAVSGNTAFSTLDLADFHATKAKLPVYPGAMNKWYISSQGYAASMEVLQMAAGGNTVVDVANGGQMMFLGSPVVFTQVLPTTLAAQASTIVAYYGDLSLATTMGTRRGIQIATDNSTYFTSDAIAVRCTERYDIACHEMGTASAAGPIIALKTASS